MALAENLKAAQEAVKYVNSLNIRAMNLLSGRLAAAGGVDNVVGTTQGMRAVFAAFDGGATYDDAFAQAGPAGVGVSAVRSKTRNVNSMIDVRVNSAEVIARRFGNCDEQAQVAMTYIYNTFPKVRPLDLLTFGNPEYDHVWVGIGLSPAWNKMVPDGRNGNLLLRIQKYSLREWGPDAVWCDPWQSGGVAFAISDLIKGAVRNLSSSYKCNTAERVEDGLPSSTLRVN